MCDLAGKRVNSIPKIVRWARRPAPEAERFFRKSRTLNEGKSPVSGTKIVAGKCCFCSLAHP